MKRWIIGDVRGELTLLKKMIDKLGPTDSDLILFLGSYIGPGSDSQGTIQYVLELQDRLPGRVLCLRGCYEYIFKFVTAEGCDWSTAELWGRMGGHSVFKSYASHEKPLYVMQTGMNGDRPKPMKVEIPMIIPESHIRFMDGLHQWYEDDIFPYIGCHSGGHPGLFGGKLESEEQTVFPEEAWWKQEWRQIPGKTVVFSHTPFKLPFRGPGKLGIDLGAGVGGKLAAFEMMSEELTIVGGKNG